MKPRIRTPWVVLPAAAAGLLLLLVPLAALVARVPWARVHAALLEPALRETIALSLTSSVLAALLAALLGIPLATWLAGGRGLHRRAVRSLVTLPMVLPPVVGGFALLLAFGREGLVTAPIGLQLPFTFLAVVLAQTFVALPFLVLAAEAGLRAVETRHLEAAASLGAGPWRVWTRVRLPLAKSSLGAGLLLAWARALGEFGATITFAGNLQGRTRTLPLAVFSALESDPEAALVLSVTLMGLALAVLFALRGRWFSVASSDPEAPR